MVKKKYFGVYNGLKKGCGWFALLLLLPALINFVWLWVYPNVSSIFLSFQDQNGEWTVGNYTWVWGQLFGEDGESIMAEALKNTLTYFFVGYFITNAWNIIVAYFLFKQLKFHRAFRFILNLPTMLAGLIMVTLYKNMIGPEGPIIQFLYNNGIIREQYMLLFDSRFAMPASVMYGVWLCIGGPYLWASAAMARIPKEVLEAAEIDGVSPFREFVQIILPLISGTLSTLYIIGISGILNAGGATLYLTYGEFGTMTLSFWLFKQIYENAGTGTTSALGLMMSAVTIPLVYLVKRIAAMLPDVSY
jgi:ABC-type sugar transport system permease subunit